ncbi:MAG TPA: ABC transporter substrate-binding protein [Tianweitania sediminis]|jgi:NitT/TauT family transport system substrate-binding protein|nr:ABC transporter substrate-binding protein [Tianweitania sediminis]
MNIRKGFLGLAATAGLIAASLGAAYAEVDTIRIAKQYGLGFLPIMVMEREGLFEKRAEEAGLTVKAEWLTLGGPAAANEALLADNVDIISNGPPSFLIFWGRTQGSAMAIRGVSPVSTLPMWLNTKNPNVKTLEDFTAKDRIAVTSVKTSIPSIIMQMYSAEKYGMDQYEKMDPLTTSLPHPDGMAALLSNTEITAHFTSPPYQYREVKEEGIHRVATSYELMGSPATFTVLYGKNSFLEANPKTVGALVRAIADAQAFIKDKPEEAADIYLAMAGEAGVSKEEVLEILADPDVQFNSVPQGFMKYAEFMAKVGTLKQAPEKWSDLFVDEIHSLQGN